MYGYFEQGGMLHVVEMSVVVPVQLFLQTLNFYRQFVYDVSIIIGSVAVGWTGR